MEKDRSTSDPPATGGSDSERKLEAAAVRLLARREHSTAELKRKLIKKGFASESVERIVQKLGAKRLVSDERFVTSFVHHHANRGQGPVRIRAELRQQGIDDQAIQDALQDAEVDWDALAGAVRRRKFGSKRPLSPSERAKQARFLQYRGFTADQIRAALNGGDGGDAEYDSDSYDPSWSD